MSVSPTGGINGLRFLHVQLNVVVVHKHVLDTVLKITLIPESMTAIARAWKANRHRTAIPTPVSLTVGANGPLSHLVPVYAVVVLKRVQDTVLMTTHTLKSMIATALVHKKKRHLIATRKPA